jgi:hypothetical protein
MMEAESNHIDSADTAYHKSAILETIFCLLTAVAIDRSLIVTTQS